MFKNTFRLQRNGNLRRSNSCRPRIEWMERRTLLSLPTLTGLSPSVGPAAGGTLVTITGTSFTGATTVDFGPTAATDLTVVSATKITADSPAGTGFVDVSITTPAGTSGPTIDGLFGYSAAAAPTVTGLSPASGPEAGGTAVMIIGTGFTGATSVDFGPTAATDLTVVSATKITADSPAGNGTAAVTVTTPAGKSAPSNADLFTYGAADQAPVITSPAATTFAVGIASTFTVTTTGIPTSALSETGALPSGMTFVDNLNGTAALAGTPAAGTAGTYPLTITAANSAPPNATQSFTLTVAAAVAPAITSAGSTTLTAGTLGTFTVTTTGIPTPALSETGALPTGVTFVDNGNGSAALSGTPVVGAGATYALTITAANGAVPDATQSFTLTVNQAPVFTSIEAADFTTGTASTFTVTTAGFPTSALSETGALPSGVTFVDNLDGTATLAGMPAAGTGGNYALTFTAANGVLPDATQSITLMVSQAPAFTSPAATTFHLVSGNTFTLTTTGFLPATLFESGALPSGVSFFNNGDGTATLSGIPATDSAGTYPLTINAANGAGQANQSFTLTVDTDQPPKITSAYEAQFTPGTFSTFTVTTTGNPTPTLSVFTGGTLPPGVTFVDNGNGTATLSGTPPLDIVGFYGFTIAAANVFGDDYQGFTVTFNLAPTITSPAATTFAPGMADTFTVTTIGNPTPTLSETGPLPSGVTFVNNLNGTAALAGTPAAGTAGTYPLTINAANGLVPNATQSFTLTVPAAEPTVTGLSPTSGPAVGGTFVTITGTGFTGATAVDFGPTAATGVTVVSATTITAHPPAGTGTVNVTVITPGGTSAISAASQFTYVAAPPTVVSLVRFGFHMQQTFLVVTFSSTLDATPAEDVNNYKIVTMAGLVIPVSGAVYDPATLTVTLFPAERLDLHKFYQLTVNGTTPSGLTGATGVPLDGLGNGTPGTNYVRKFSGKILAGPAPALLSAERNKMDAEQKELAAEEKKLAAEPKKPAAAQKALVVQLRLVKSPSPSAVDALSAMGKLTARTKAVRIRVGHLHPRR